MLAFMHLIVALASCAYKWTLLWWLMYVCFQAARVSRKLYSLRRLVTGVCIRECTASRKPPMQIEFCAEALRCWWWCWWWKDGEIAGGGMTMSNRWACNDASVIARSKEKAAGTTPTVWQSTCDVVVIRSRCRIVDMCAERLFHNKKIYGLDDQHGK